MPKEDPSSLAEGLDRAYRDRGAWLREVAARGGREEAQDVVHDAVVKTLEAEQRAPVLDPLRFLAQVTRNAVVDRFRSRARRGRVVQAGLETPDVPDQAPSAERMVIASERLQQALAVIERMPPRRREAFLLCRIEELTYAQAARRMGVSIHAIEKHMSSAMAQLFAAFEESDDAA
jgi:RNA polymerase sigma factor (sigma-70 family)